MKLIYSLLVLTVFCTNEISESKLSESNNNGLDKELDDMDDNNDDINEDISVDSNDITYKACNMFCRRGRPNTWTSIEQFCSSAPGTNCSQIPPQYIPEDLQLDTKNQVGFLCDASQHDTGSSMISPTNVMNGSLFEGGIFDYFKSPTEESTHEKEEKEEEKTQQYFQQVEMKNVHGIYRGIVHDSHYLGKDSELNQNLSIDRFDHFCYSYCTLPKENTLDILVKQNNESEYQENHSIRKINMLDKDFKYLDICDDPQKSLMLNSFLEGRLMMFLGTGI